MWRTISSFPDSWVSLPQNKSIPFLWFFPICWYMVGLRKIFSGVKAYSITSTEPAAILHEIYRECYHLLYFSKLWHPLEDLLWSSVKLHLLLQPKFPSGHLTDRSFYTSRRICHSSHGRVGNANNFYPFQYKYKYCLIVAKFPAWRSDANNEEHK